jgi:GTP:adenosylcobinamide-phosphate guanylyltransferase
LLLVFFCEAALVSECLPKLFVVLSPHNPKISILIKEAITILRASDNGVPKNAIPSIPVLLVLRSCEEDFIVLFGDTFNEIASDRFRKVLRDVDSALV